MRTAVTTLLLALCLLACGASVRERTIATTLVATDAARAAFIVYDAAHQADLVATATSLDDGRARLDAYRRQRDPVVQSFAAAYKSIAAAAVLTKDPASLPAMLEVAKLLRQALADLGVKP